MNKKNTTRRRERNRHAKLERFRIGRKKASKKLRDWGRECIRRSRVPDEEPEENK
jgi:hypothetical protein